MTQDGIEAVQDKVLDALNRAQEPNPPGYLVRALTEEGYPETLVLAAIWRLLAWRRARLTPDLNLAPLAKDASLGSAGEGATLTPAT